MLCPSTLSVDNSIVKTVNTPKHLGKSPFDDLLVIVSLNFSNSSFQLYNFLLRVK